MDSLLISHYQSPLKPISDLHFGVLVPAMLLTLLLVLVPSLLQANTHCKATTAAEGIFEHKASTLTGSSLQSRSLHARSLHDRTAHISAEHGADFVELIKGCHGDSCSMPCCSGSVCDIAIGCSSLPPSSQAFALAERRSKLAQLSTSFDSPLLQVADFSPLLPSITAGCNRVALISAEFISPPLFYRLCVMRL